MNRLLNTLALTGLLSTPFLAFAAGDNDPKTALPVDSVQPKKSGSDNASKSGEEASGGNAGTDAETLKKEAATTKGEKEDGR